MCYHIFVIWNRKKKDKKSEPWEVIQWHYPQSLKNTIATQTDCFNIKQYWIVRGGITEKYSTHEQRVKIIPSKGKIRSCMKTLRQDCAFSLGRVRHRDKAEGPDGRAWWRLVWKVLDKELGSTHADPFVRSWVFQVQSKTLNCFNQGYNQFSKMRPFKGVWRDGWEARMRLRRLIRNSQESMEEMVAWLGVVEVDVEIKW